MALKLKYQVQEIPPQWTAQQVEDALNNAGQSGWEVVQFVAFGNKIYVIAKRVLTI